MAAKRGLTLYSAIVQAGWGDDRDLDINVFDAVRVVIEVELEHLGFKFDAIERWATYWNSPSEELLQSKIDSFEPHDHHVMLQVPLSIEAYKNRFKLLSFAYDIEESALVDAEQKVPISEWLSLALFLGFLLSAADIEIDLNYMMADLGRKSGLSRRGKRYSMARMAIDYAISQGHDSTASIQEYFESEPDIKEIEIDVYCDVDDHGQTTGFTFKNRPTGKSRSLQIDSLAPTVSELRS